MVHLLSDTVSKLINKIIYFIIIIIIIIIINRIQMLRGHSSLTVLGNYVHSLVLKKVRLSHKILYIFTNFLAKEVILSHQERMMVRRE